MQTQVDKTGPAPILHIVPSLSKELRLSTAKAHQSAEGASFIKSLFQGICSENAYISYLWSLRKIYATLEIALRDNKNDEHVSHIYFPELFRSESLNEDFQNWNPTSEVDPTQLLEESIQAYTGRLQHLGESRPDLLVAHAYVRYLGDLSGGQILGRILLKHFPNGKSLRFYQYDFSDVEQMKTLYRERLDEIGLLPGTDIQEVCAEAQNAFRLNEHVFSALSEIV